MNYSKILCLSCFLILAISVIPKGATQDVEGIGAQPITAANIMYREKSSIKALVERSAECWNAKDIDGLMETFWHSPDPIYVIGDQAFVGWQKTKEHFLNTYPERSTMGRVVNDQIEIRIVNADTAVTVSSWTMTNTARITHGISTSTLRRFPFGWRFVCCAVSIL